MPTSPRVIGPVRASPDAQRPRVAQRALDQRSVDGQGAGLVEPGHGREFGDRVEEGDEAAGGQDRGRVIRRLGALGQAHGGGAQGIGHLGQQAAKLVVALDRDGRPAEGVHGPLQVGEGDERMEGARLGPGRHRRRQDVRPQRAAGVDHGLAAVQPDAARERLQRVVRDGEDDEFDFLDEGLCLGEPARPVDEAREPLPPDGIPTGDGEDRPAGPRQGDAERRPDGSAADDPGDRALPRPGVLVRMCVAVGVDLLAVAMVAGRQRVEVDPRVLEGRLGRRALARGVVTGQRTPGLHRATPRRRVGRGTLPPIECSEPAETDALSSNRTTDPFGARTSLGSGLPDIYRLDALGGALDGTALPITVRILLENVLRHAGGGVIDPADVETLAAWRPGVPAEAEIPFMPSRVILQDFTGVPAIVDLAVMRDAMAALGGDPSRVNPLVPADLVIDHSVQIDRFGTPAAFAFNVEREYERNGERYQLLRWAQTAFRDFRVVPPGTGIVHQVNLEFLATVVDDRDGVAFPDTLVGTDSHTTMVNGLGVLGYGVGGIEAEAVLLGQPLYQPMPHVVGVRLTGELPRGSTATDLVLVVTEMLRSHGVVGAFVEFAGDGLASLSLPDRATISNMSPEFGATTTLFPIDDETLAYLRLTGRTPERVDLVERYAKEQGLWREPGDGPAFDEALTLDLSTVEPSVAGPRRPQDRVPLEQLRDNFHSNFPTGLEDPVRDRRGRRQRVRRFVPGLGSASVRRGRRHEWRLAPGRPAQRRRAAPG